MHCINSAEDYGIVIDVEAMSIQCLPSEFLGGSCPAVAVFSTAPAQDWGFFFPSLSGPFGFEASQTPNPNHEIFDGVCM